MCYFSYGYMLGEDMNKKEILNKYKNEEERLLVSKIIDKINNTKKRNKIVTTDFMDLYQQEIAKNTLNELKENNYKFFGGVEESERKVLIIYPEKLSKIYENDVVNKNEIISVVRIEVPNDLKGKYVHKDYLGSLMKLGIKREKVGDILVDENGADILAIPDISEYIELNLHKLTRFRKATIEKINIENLRRLCIKKELKEIIVPSLRIDCIVSELIGISRNKANDIIESERVFVNFKNETKSSKNVSIGDKITIRGKGRFEIKERLRITKNNKTILLIEKYI